jgi:NADH:ubiquinone oxidoreductase subunit 4 (subunit M)
LKQPYDWGMVCEEGHIAQAALLLLLGSLIAHEVRKEWRGQTIAMTTIAASLSMLVSCFGTMSEIQKRSFDLLTWASLASFGVAITVVIYRCFLVSHRIKRNQTLQATAH